MADELQHLLERIQKDGVDKAQADATQILEKARQQAAAIVAEAETRARQSVAKAEQDSQRFAEQGKRSLEHSARDLLLTLDNAILNTFRGIVAEEVQQSLTGESLRNLIARTLEAYFKSPGAQERVEVVVNPQDQKQVADFLVARFKAAMEKGLQVRPDSDVLSGFKVVLKGGQVSHDFTREAVTESLCALVRPHLAGILRKAAKTGGA